MQSKQELEKWYEKADPWGYEKNPDDIERKKIILDHLDGTYQKALDIGCGEGWITKDLPATEIYGLELSDNAAERFPEGVKRVLEPEGKYDLIITTGTLYRQYDYRRILEWIKEHASGIVLTCNIASWEINDLGEAFLEVNFPYRNYKERLALYDLSTAQCSN